MAGMCAGWSVSTVRKQYIAQEYVSGYECSRKEWTSTEVYFAKINACYDSFGKTSTT